MLSFKNKLILAPMAGVADTVFRRLCKKNGADIVVSEMVSAEGLHYNSSSTEALMMFDACERPVGVQLFGANPERLAQAARIVEEKVGPEFIDLNCGCPVSKVVKRNGGSALLKEPKLFEQIVKALTAAVSTPVTVKIRSGWNKHEWVDEEFARIAEANGAAAIAVHPRSQTMIFSGHSLWERIEIVKKAVSIPVIGNGDILSGEDAVRMFSRTGCDAVMIGRGSYGNPWIFSEIRAAIEGRSYEKPTWEERCATVLEHIGLFRKVHGEQRARGEMKKHAAWYLKGTPGASAARNRICQARDSHELEEIVQNLFSVMERTG
ncbi:MAG: tRNA dihydrouridine synthase DusB [Chitinispirillaceae bacterium]